MEVRPEFKGKSTNGNWGDSLLMLDHDFGSILDYLTELGIEDNTIVMYSTDNGAETFTWPDGGTTPFAQCKGTVMEGGFRVLATSGAARSSFFPDVATLAEQGHRELVVREC